MRYFLLTILLSLSGLLLTAQKTTFTITDVYSVTGSGTIVVGRLNDGEIMPGERLRFFRATTPDKPNDVRVNRIASGRNFIGLADQPGEEYVLHVSAPRNLFPVGMKLIGRNMDLQFKINNIKVVVGKGTVVTGKIRQGRARVGDRVDVVGIPFGRVSTMITGIERQGGYLTTAIAGDDLISFVLRGISPDQIRPNAFVVEPGAPLVFENSGPPLINRKLIHAPKYRRIDRD